MTIIDDEPIRRATPLKYERPRLPMIRTMELPAPKYLPGTLMSAVRGRRSGYEFVPPSLTELSTWLYFSAAVQSSNSEDRNRQLTYSASFGALHPEHIIIRQPTGEWFFYLANEHKFGAIQVANDASASAWSNVQQFYRAPRAALIALVSDRDLTEAYYQNSMSLILRNAGVLLGHGAIVAAGLGLPFRILGGTGAPWIYDIFKTWPFTPVACGLAFLGGAGSAVL
jgi:hypothetical protein